MTSNVQRKAWPFRVSQVPQEMAVPMDVKAGAGDPAKGVAMERVRSQSAIRPGLVADVQPRGQQSHLMTGYSFFAIIKEIGALRRASSSQLRQRGSDGRRDSAFDIYTVVLCAAATPLQPRQ